MTTLEKIKAFELLIGELQKNEERHSGMCDALTHELMNGSISVCDYVYIDCLIKKELKELNKKELKEINLVYLFDNPKTTPRIIWLFTPYETAPRIEWCESKIKQLKTEAL